MDFSPEAIDLEIPQQSIRSCEIFNTRKASLAAWPCNAVIAEVGVAFGAFSKPILSVVKPSRFIAIDTFRWHKNSDLNRLYFKGSSHLDFYISQFSGHPLRDVIDIQYGLSWEVLSRQQEKSIDIIYLDAAHDYQSVKTDVAAGLPALRKGGLLVFNDYIYQDHKKNVPYGVVSVVNQMLASGRWEARYLALHPQMYCDIALVEKDFYS